MSRFEETGSVLDVKHELSVLATEEGGYRFIQLVDGQDRPHRPEKLGQQRRLCI